MISRFHYTSFSALGIFCFLSYALFVIAECVVYCHTILDGRAAFVCVLPVVKLETVQNRAELSIWGSHNSVPFQCRTYAASVNDTLNELVSRLYTALICRARS